MTQKKIVIFIALLFTFYFGIGIDTYAKEECRYTVSKKKYILIELTTDGQNPKAEINKICSGCVSDYKGSKLLSNLDVSNFIDSKTGNFACVERLYFVKESHSDLGSAKTYTTYDVYSKIQEKYEYDIDIVLDVKNSKISNKPAYSSSDNKPEKTCNYRKRMPDLLGGKWYCDVTVSVINKKLVGRITNQNMFAKIDSKITLPMFDNGCPNLSVDCKDVAKDCSDCVVNLEGDNLTEGEESLTNDQIGELKVINVGEQNCQTLLGDPEDPNSMAYFLQKILNYIKILGPALVLVLSGYDFIKAVVISDEETLKKAQKKLYKRLIAVILLFLIPSIISLLFGIVNSSIVDPTCSVK